MGSAGIKRRKKRRRANAEPEERMSEGDVQRLFGRFTWGAYSPAGALEREGFFWRQLTRRKPDGWSVIGYVLFAVFAIPFLLGVIAVVVNAVR